ncbi:putative aldouronate transport system permease protein [Paenibacillus endophyticus]|uniref:Putative aldouronate transport system permease protein n=1 Tax=Paenibacillus endophyticus TaxID=1294268 RepID=A0A7W5C6D3_9BACL|nr:ABC transporter permease subunit [Paenibacillus endophyticus]MBB3151873.1 putative aldouronate transport system permease protein [Paenibacillus endophyticus]
MKMYFRKTWPLHLFLLPSVLLLIVFNYIPMAGFLIGFEDFKPWLGILKSPFVGLKHFKFMFNDPTAIQVIWNTFIIAIFKIIVGAIVPFAFSLFLNEVRAMLFKRTIQSLIYLPHFLNWVILGGILTDLLATNGLINQLLEGLGLNRIFFLGSGDWFRFTLVTSDVWKEFGFGTIIYLAAMTGINQSLYEAADIDGANNFNKAIHITIPAVIPIAIVIATLSLGNILNAGFDQVYNMYNPLVYQKGDIIDTYVYRVGLLQGSFSLATAVGFFKSVIGFVLIATTYKLASKYANYRIF